MLGSVWREEIYTALEALARAKVQYRNVLGQLATPNVVRRSLDEDFADTVSYPCVVLYIYGGMDNPRLSDETREQAISLNPATATGQFREPYQGYTLSLQVELWATDQTMLDDMVRTWAYSVKKNYSLQARDTNGNLVKCAMNRVGKPFNFEIFNGKDTGKQNLCRCVFSYEVWAGLCNAALNQRNITVSRELRNSMSKNTIIIAEDSEV